MRFPPSFLDEIRARLSVSDVVGRRVKLKKQGREWRGLSPFNAEKTPSFYVNDQKGFYHDFSSGKHGNQFTFLMETEGLTFVEAVERLAAEAGLALPTVSPEALKREEARRTLFEVMELAARYFEDSLQARIGAHARGYLADRDIRAETIAEFRIGYAPNERGGLRDHLAGKGVSREDMIAAGLLVHGEDIPVAYDRFRERVMFPIQDMRGRIVAFGGRALEKDVPAKYLNSPETELFHKGSVVFNGHRARKAAHDTGRLIVVEGYVDVISLAQAGIIEAVAPLGTALTEEQLDLAWRLVEEPILCFDGDKAGVRAAHRAIDIALPKIGPGKSLRFALLPSGLDPDDLVRRRGRDAMEEVLKAARPLSELLWERETAGSDLATPERRAALEQRLRGLIATIADPVVKRHYEDDMRGRLRALMAPAWPERRRDGFDRVRAFERRQARPGGRGAAREPIAISESLRRSALLRGRSADWPLREALLVALLANHPSLVELHAETFAALDLDDPELTKLRDAILDIVTSEPVFDHTQVDRALERHGLGAARRRLALLAERTGLWFVSPKAAPADAETSWLQMAALHRRARALHRELKMAETALGLDPNEENHNRLRALRLELSAADGTEALIEGYGVLSGKAQRTS